ncbi:MAG: energy transducer TonB [Verrucomicrobia bacterium]|nr:energy transducer TonB [Verrucomicrobiota bacterium]
MKKKPLTTAAAAIFGLSSLTAQISSIYDGGSVDVDNTQTTGTYAVEGAVGNPAGSLSFSGIGNDSVLFASSGSSYFLTPNKVDFSAPTVVSFDYLIPEGISERVLSSFSLKVYFPDTRIVSTVLKLTSHPNNKLTADGAWHTASFSPSGWEPGFVTRLENSTIDGSVPQQFYIALKAGLPGLDMKIDNVSVSVLAANTHVRLKEGSAPAYPKALKQQGIEGEAKIKATIDENGVVTAAELVSATHEPFGPAALDAVRSWSFYPAREDHRPVAETVTIPVAFILTPKERLNAVLGREMFVDITKLTDKVCTWSDVKRWFPPVGKILTWMPYPKEMKGSGISEEITVNLIVSPEGLVLNPRFENLKNSELLMPAIHHLARMRFEIPKVDGKPVYLEQKVRLQCSEDPNFLKKK